VLAKACFEENRRQLNDHPVSSNLNRLMQFSSTQCDPDLLRQSLSDALSERQEEALALHLEQCTTCRDLMESLAGTRDDWTRIEAALRTEQSSDDLRSSDSGDSADGNRFIADFAVHFLEPAGDTDALGAPRQH
jgi:hypothetical protein